MAAKFRAQKTDLYGVYRIVNNFNGGIARILKAGFSEYEDAKEWAKKYSKEHFDCDMAIDTIDATIRAWDGTVSSMTLVK